MIIFTLLISSSILSGSLEMFCSVNFTSLVVLFPQSGLQDTILLKNFNIILNARTLMLSSQSFFYLVKNIFII